ncbi:DUF4346 domain-containing protein [Niabella ginsenosidivorans]|nr:hypothetical protein [Niabella ginsenosidivorans]
MHLLASLFPDSATGENPAAVKLFYQMLSVKAFFNRLKNISGNRWPPYPGNYQIIHPQGQIALCTLTSDELIPVATLPENVAITGTLMTPNLGIERMILNILSNPNIRHLILCGKESPVFKAGQAIECLFSYRVDHEKRIINAEGHFPVLMNLSEENISRFLKQTRLISIKNEKRTEVIQQKINELALKTEPYHKRLLPENKVSEDASFTELKPGGKRIPLDYDQKGFFVITTDSKRNAIQVKHYYRGNRPGYFIKGRSSESILLAILEKGLVSQMSHAGYLGAELAKAETALKLDLKYTQDQPLKRST